MAVVAAYQVAQGLEGCTVAVKPFVMDTVPVSTATTQEPSVSPVITMYKGLVSIDVQVTGSAAVQVQKPPTCLPGQSPHVLPSANPTLAFLTAIVLGGSCHVTSSSQ
jgi:hypothetical protein